MHKWFYGFGVFTLISGFAFSISGWLTEIFYFNFVFRILRNLYDYTLGFLPFASVYIIYFCLLNMFVWSIYKWSKLKFRFDDWLSGFYRFGAFIVFFGSLFYWAWGFNYNRVSLENQLELKLQKIELKLLLEHSNRISQKMNDIRMLSNRSSLLIPVDLELKIRTGLSDVIKKLGFPVYGKPRVRILRPTGTLLRISTAGVYFPYAFEGHIDAGLHSIQHPFTMAHEMSHAYGFTDEAACNFLAYLACIGIDDLQIQYSGLMGYWRYLLFDIKYNYPEHWEKHWEEISPGLKKDIAEIRKQMDKFPDILPKIRNFIYDNYLKSHGVKSGIKSYSRVVELVTAWEIKIKE